MDVKNAPRIAEERRAYSDARWALFVRSRGVCEGCGRKLTIGTMQFSHRLPRSAGRNDDPSNGLALCFACHALVHDRPTEARSTGWAISRYDPRPPHEIPVLLRDQWWLLPQGGGRATIAQNPAHILGDGANNGDPL